MNVYEGGTGASTGDFVRAGQGLTGEQKAQVTIKTKSKKKSHKQNRKNCRYPKKNLNCGLQNIITIKPVLKE